MCVYVCVFICLYISKMFFACFNTDKPLFLDPTDVSL